MFFNSSFGKSRSALICEKDQFVTVKTFVLFSAIFLLVEIPAPGREQKRQESQSLQPEHYDIYLKLLTPKADLDHRTQQSTQAIFRQYMERASGLDLREFFRRWFHTGQQLPEEWK